MCLLKNFITFEAARYKISSNINEVIRSVLNFFFFFHDKISTLRQFSFLTGPIKLDFVRIAAVCTFTSLVGPV